MNQPAYDEAIVIRGSFGKHLKLAISSLGFIVVGVLMLTLSPPSHWTLPGSRIIQSAAGVLAMLFGGLGLVTLFYVATRPILLLRPTGITDCRRWIVIPFADVRAATTAGQLIYLDVTDPARYADLERWSKQSGLSDAGLTLDLSLAAAADFQRARQYIEEHVQ